MASIDKRGNGYRVRYRSPDGKSRSQSFKRMVEAKKFKTSVEHSIQASTYVDPAGGRQTLEQWWTYCSGQSRHRPSTKARDEVYAKAYILDTLGDYPLGKLTYVDIESWVTQLSDRGLKPATVVKAAQILGRTLKHAVRAKVIPFNPAEGIRLPKVELKEKRALTPAEITRLCNSTDDRYRPMVMFAAYTGLRFGELCALTRKDIDLMRNTVRVSKTVVEVDGRHVVNPPKTKRSIRTVSFPKSVGKALKDCTHGLGANDLLFPAPQGGFIRASLFRRRFWAPAVEAAELSPLTFHELRDTAITLWIGAGATPKEVAARAGHTSVVTVLDRYGHLFPGAEDKVNDKLDSMFREGSKSKSAKVVPLRVQSVSKSKAQ